MNLYIFSKVAFGSHKSYEALSLLNGCTNLFHSSRQRHFDQAATKSMKGHERFLPG